MNEQDVIRLSINGIALQDQQIVDYCSRHNEINIQKIGSFVAEWMNDQPTIEVKTSGSTGKPKSILLRKSQLLESARATALYFDFKVGQNGLLCLPVDYIAGKMMIVRAIYSGLNLVCIEPGSTPLERLNREQEIDFAPLLPMQLFQCRDTHLVKKILLGGSSMSGQLEVNMESLKAEIYHGYGMTETISHIAVRRVNGSSKSPYYQALPGMWFELDSRGCLIVHVPYLSEAVVTNDLVELDGRYRMKYLGRVDNVINSGGIKLLPEIIEPKIAKLMSGRYFVVGIKDVVLGQRLCLIVEGMPLEPVRESILLNSIANQLDKYEKPREIYYLEHFEMTDSGKIQRGKCIEKLGLER